MLRMLTGLKFPILVLSVPPLSSGTTAARLAFLGKFEVRILLFIASVTGLIDLFTDSDAILKILSVDFCGKVKVNSNSSSKTV